MDELEFEHKVLQLHDAKEYRPTSSNVLYGADPLGNIEFLVAQSAKSPVVWQFPQGGIDPGETLISAMSRELNEELGILPEEFVDVNLAFFYAELGAEPGRDDKRGFRRGKAYFFNLARYTGSGKFVLRPKEIADAQFMHNIEAIEHFFKGRHERGEMLEKVIAEAFTIITDLNNK